MALKETKEVLAAVEKLTLSCIDQGVSLNDFMGAAPEIFAAVEGAKGIGAEVTAMALADYQELTQWGVDFAFKIVAMVKAQNPTP